MTVDEAEALAVKSKAQWNCTFCALKQRNKTISVLILYFFTYKPRDFFQYILTEIWVIFHKKQGLAYTQGFGIKKKNAEFSGFTFFPDNMILMEGVLIFGSLLMAKISL